MGTVKVERPVWRRFSPQYRSRAAEWVKRGGAAAIVFEAAKPSAIEVRGDDLVGPRAVKKVTRIEMLLDVDADGVLTELSLWSILALEQRQSRVVSSGPARGLRIALAARHSIPSVLDWCDRDSVFEEPTRMLAFDCLECGACCHEADVILGEDDLDRFREAGRDDLTTSKYIKRTRDGKVRLRFAKSGACQHLGSDLKCGIYALRPYNCSVFPVGSEACLAARESTRRWRDDGSPNVLTAAPPRVGRRVPAT